jgi:predicted O-linked N-acetylglucosamine transferase (SPINDLY family)
MQKAKDAQSGFQQAVKLYRRGDLRRALAQCQSALKLQPRSVPGLHLLGAIQLRLDEAIQAVATFDRLLAINPGNAEALNHRGVALQQLVRLKDALASFDAALKSKPAYPEALNNRATVLKDLDRPQEALQSIDRSLSLAGDSVAALCNRGTILSALQRDDEALAMYDRALALDGRSAVALSSRANVLYARGRIDEAVRTYQKLLTVDPARPYVVGSMIDAKLTGCDWTDLGETVADAIRRVERGEPAIHPFTFSWICDSPALQRRCAEIYGAREWPAPARAAPAITLQRRPRVRLGYLSGDFREHPVAYGFASLLERHDRARFEVVALSYGGDADSDMRKRVERGVDRFVDLRQHGLEETVAAIRAEQVDIMIDLAGFTGGGRGGNRGAALAYRLAPIQVNHQGQPTAAKFFDYIISDHVVVPQRLRPFYREKIVRLPDCCLPTDNSQTIAPGKPARAAEGLPPDAFVFCCFNTIHKLQPATFDVWMRLLHRVPGSVLWLRQNNDAVVGNLRREAASRDISPDRLVFAQRKPMPEHLARHQLADLFLDTFPMGAQTTGWHSLFAGLPFISRIGETFFSRASGSLLQAAGLPELCVDTVEEYEGLALKLAQDPVLLGGFRERLRAARLTQPLFDSERYRRRLETAYQLMYERCLAGEAPADFDVPP